MSLVKRGTRAGVAAVALGLSLAGPQAAGLAWAEPADDGPSSASTPGPDQSAAPNRIRAGRSATTTGTPTGGAGDTVRRARVRPDIAHSTAIGSAVPIVADAIGSAPAGRVPGRRSPVGRDAVVIPAPVSGQGADPVAGAATGGDGADGAGITASASAVPALPAQTVAATDPVPAATATTVTGPGSSAAVSAPVAGPSPVAPAGPIARISSAVDIFFDSASDWLSGLPANPVVEFIEGALLLVRRTLATVFPALAAGQTTGETAGPGTGAAMTDAELNAYLLELAQQQYGDLFGQTIPVYGYGPWPMYLKDESVRGGAGGVSDTNTQVDGVDEADFVETDGQYVYVAHNGQLTIVRTDLTVASESALSGDVLGSYLSGDRLTVITQTGGGWYGPTVRIAAGYWGPWDWNPQTTLTVYDVSDRTAPEVVNQTVFDGGYQSSRSVDGVVYLVLQRSVDLPAPEYTETPVKGTADTDGQADALLHRPWGGSDITAYRTYETWDAYVARVGPDIGDLALPHAYAVDADGNQLDLGLLAGAGDIVRPHSEGHSALLTAISVDSATDGTGFADSVGVLVSATGGAVYMTADALYVASNESNHTDSGWSTDTRIDRFAVAGTEIGWQANGVVSGTLINQFAMDERDGHLRVATHTVSSQLVDGTWSTRNDSGIYVLDTAGNTLDEVGQVSGLAPGERLYAARFIGDTGYLVTFLQTDPLFAVDLSDPADPVLLGELIVPGFSNYLQPVGDGLLLGIGQEREAGTGRTHLHASLFDVSDGTNLTQIEREFLYPGYQWSWSNAQFDHHALLYSAEDGLLVVPVAGSGYDAQGGYRYDQFLKVLRVTPDGLDVVGEIHTADPVLRTVRIGDVLYAVGATSVTAYRVSDLTEIGSSNRAVSV